MLRVALGYSFCRLYNIPLLAQQAPVRHRIAVLDFGYGT